MKNGTGTLTLGAVNSFTGAVVFNSGTLVAGGSQATSLGSATTAGRTITMNSPGTLSFTSNNVYGNGVGNSNLPATILNRTSLTSTRYNVLGDVTLNGATLTQSSTDSGNFEGFQFRGNVTVIGSTASTISTGNSKANHLGPNTVIDAGTAGQINLVVVPEPGTFTALLGGLGMLVGAQRYRRRKSV